MLSLVPQLHSLVDGGASRTTTQLRQLGVEPAEHSVTVAVSVVSTSPARVLLAKTLIDMLLRLDPLVGRVIIATKGMDEEGLVSELSTNVPLSVEYGSWSNQYSIDIGESTGYHDLVVDGAGWMAALNETVNVNDDGNPIGALATAALGAAEVFKAAFSLTYPDVASTLQFENWNGSFSLFSYRYGGSSPAISPISIDTTLVGVGGVGAGFLRAIAALGPLVTGFLKLVDADVLNTHNLNRVSYATVEAAKAQKSKILEAERWVREYCPNLIVNGFRETFNQYRSRLSPRREDRRYDVMVTALDKDEARWTAQRDLPRVLIDGSTGRDMVARLERVEFGKYGCLGCTRRSLPSQIQGDCGSQPDERAPSLSFVSAYPGILAAGEVIKEALGLEGLRGQFDHVFRYGPNPDAKRIPAIRDDCMIQCSRSSKIEQYGRKYPVRTI